MRSLDPCGIIGEKSGSESSEAEHLPESPGNVAMAVAVLPPLHAAEWEGNQMAHTLHKRYARPIAD